MNDKTLVERLDILIKDDHERGCQGRYYSCTCGYDNDCSQAMQDAKSRIEALEAALRPFAYALETHEEVGRPYADDDRINIVQEEGCLLAELDESHFYQARQALAGDDHGHR